MTPAASQRHRAWWAAALVATALLAAYWPALHAGWIWDDDSYVTQNAVVQAADGWWRAWVPGQTPQYYPLVFMSFWAQHALHGLNPMPYHAVNVLLHLASAALLWRLLERLGMRGAGLAAIVFALHPVQVESVAWVTERKNVLSMALALLSVLAWVRSRESDRGQAGRWLALCLVAFVAAMLAKTTAVAVPVALGAIEWWKRRPVRGAHAAALGLLLAIGLAMGLNTAYVEATHVGAQGAEFSKPMLERLLQAGQAWWFYLASWVWPVDISFIYPPFTRGPGDAYAWAAVAGMLAVVVAGAWLARRGARGPLALTVVYSAGVFPALGFIAVWPLRYAPVADHFGYVGGVAACTAIGWLLALVWQRLQGRGVSAGIGIAAAAALAALLGVLTWQATLPYRDEATLWRWTLERNPQAWIAANNLGSMHLALARTALESGDPQTVALNLERADELVARAVELTEGRDMPALSNMSEVRRLQGRLPEALAAVDKAIAANPAFAGTYWMRARLHEQLGNVEGAAQDYATAVQREPRNTVHLHEHMRFLVKQGRMQDALAAAQRLAALQPGNAETQGNLGNLLLANSMPVEARPQLERALALAGEPLTGQIAVRLADAYMRSPVEQRGLLRARELAEALVRGTNREQPVPLLLLARAQALAGQRDGARATLAEADARLQGADDATRAACAEFRERAETAIGSEGAQPAPQSPADSPRQPPP